MIICDLPVTGCREIVDDACSSFLQRAAREIYDPYAEYYRTA
jgi:hypothetical protein